MRFWPVARLSSAAAFLFCLKPKLLHAFDLIKDQIYHCPRVACHNAVKAAESAQERVVRLQGRVQASAASPATLDRLRHAACPACWKQQNGPLPTPVSVLACSVGLAYATKQLSSRHYYSSVCKGSDSAHVPVC